MKTLFVIAIVTFSEAIGSHLQGSAWNQQPSEGPQYAANIKYNGPIALPPGYDKFGAPLPVLDTPEVAQLKAEHQRIYAEILSNLIAKGLYEPDYTQEQINAYAQQGSSSLPVPQSNSYLEQTSSRLAQHSNSYAQQGSSSSAPQSSSYLQQTPSRSAPKSNSYAQARSSSWSVPRRNSYVQEKSSSWSVPHTNSYVQQKSSSSSAPQRNSYAQKRSTSWTIPQSNSYDEQRPSSRSASQGSSSWPVQNTQQISAEHIRYNGPIALPPGYDKNGAPLPVLETPEVAHLKAEHLRIYAETLANLIAKGLYEPDHTQHENQNKSW